MSLVKKIMIGIGAVGIIALSLVVTQLATKQDGAKATQETEVDSTMVQADEKKLGYSDKIFDESYVHTIDVQISEEDLQDLLENAIEEKFYPCNLVIDGEIIENVGIRAKGNSSLRQVAQSDSNRYSFKVNFGKYTKGQEYYGLDKMALNNIISDATFMKDYITYKMMGDFGVASPQVSYSYITINGEEWGLYLNVEDIDESFMERNYGEDYGELYKPSTDDEMMNGVEALQGTEGQASQDRGMLQDKRPHGRGGMTTEANGADLVYVNDDEVSYSNIFDNAKTDITDEDKKSLITAIKVLNEGTHLDEFIDIEAVLRYFVVHNFVDNYDSYTGNMLHNYYLYQDHTGKLSMLPWDYNVAFGAFGGMGGGKQPRQQNGPMQAPAKEGQNDKTQASVGEGQHGLVQMPQGRPMSSDATSMVNMAIDTPLLGASEEDRPMWSQLINNSTYKNMYHQLFDEFITNYIESGSVLEEINRVQEMLTPYVQKDPTAFYTYEEFITGAETLKQFIALRGESIRGQLNGIIPSTTEEQSANKEVLIDASNINITNMGSQDGMQAKDRKKQ